MAIQERAEEILDKLTQDVKIEDAAVMVAGFYAGMNGYTPLTAIMKMIVQNDNKSITEASIISMFGIPGLAIKSLFEIVTPEQKQEAALNNIIPLDRMDPRKITTDYLYERMIYLKEIVRTGDFRISMLQKEIDQYNAEIINAMNNLSSYQSQLNAGFPQNNRIHILEGWIRDAVLANQRLNAAIQEELKKVDPREDYLDTLQQAINDNIERINTWTAELNILLSTKETWTRNLNEQIRILSEFIDDRKQTIENKKTIIQNIKDEMAGANSELGQIERKLLEIRLSLGMVGLIEAYTISRIGIGEILKGVGEIVPL